MISKQAEGVHCVLSGYPGLECLLNLMMFFMICMYFSFLLYYYYYYYFTKFVEQCRVCEVTHILALFLYMYTPVNDFVSSLSRRAFYIVLHFINIVPACYLATIHPNTNIGQEARVTT